jgi:hypothetical protein
MGEAAATTATSLHDLRITMEASIHELRASLDLLHGNIARIDTTQQQLKEQMALASTAVESSAKANNAVARQLAALEQQIMRTSQPLDHDRGRPPSPEEDEADPEMHVGVGKAMVRSAHVTWTGNTPGASSASSLGVEGEASHTQGGDGILGDGRTGGAGGGGSNSGNGRILGGAGGGRTRTEDTPRHNLKMSFPRFDGTQPRIWKDKCLDYFRLFNVNPSLWLISCTLHMEGNAALWLKDYRLRQEIPNWIALIAAVKEKFGADDHRKFMK